MYHHRNQIKHCIDNIQYLYDSSNIDDDIILQRSGLNTNANDKLFLLLQSNITHSHILKSNNAYY